ncbi:MAG: PD-(D/E)XK nuclease family protein [bacterium]|nr:PD-(D/E)XK nuclease family protein [bacterium]
MANSLQELVVAAVPTAISEQQISNLRDDLNGKLEEALTGWDRPEGPLRITKDRLRRSMTCTAQLMGGGPAALNEHLAIGRVVDVAASVLALAPAAPHERIENGQQVPGTWRHAIAEPLRTEDLDLKEWYEALSAGGKRDYDETVEARCEELKRAIGNLTEFTVISQSRTIIDLAADVVLSGRPDLVVLGPERVIVEIKSGKGFGIDDELAFYALVDALSQGAAPSVIVGVSLLPSTAVTPQAVNLDLLQRTADRVMQAVRRCRTVDESVAKNRWPLTSSGRHCLICDHAERCPDIPDELLEEALLMNNHELDDDFYNNEEEA